VHPVEVRGQDFVDTVTNKRLMIVGVDYQPGGQGAYKPSQGLDALTDADICLRDATLMQKLGVRTLAAAPTEPWALTLPRSIRFAFTMLTPRSIIRNVLPSSTLLEST